MFLRSYRVQTLICQLLKAAGPKCDEEEVKKESSDPFEVFSFCWCYWFSEDSSEFISIKCEPFLSKILLSYTKQLNLLIPIFDLKIDHSIICKFWISNLLTHDNSMLFYEYSCVVWVAGDRWGRNWSFLCLLLLGISSVWFLLSILILYFSSNSQSTYFSKIHLRLIYIYLDLFRF